MNSRVKEKSFLILYSIVFVAYFQIKHQILETFLFNKTVMKSVGRVIYYELHHKLIRSYENL